MSDVYQKTFLQMQSRQFAFTFAKVHVERKVNLLHMASLPEKLHGKGGSNVLQGRSRKL